MDDVSPSSASVIPRPGRVVWLSRPRAPPDFRAQSLKTSIAPNHTRRWTIGLRYGNGNPTATRRELRCLRSGRTNAVFPADVPASGLATLKFRVNFRTVCVSRGFLCINDNRRLYRATFYVIYFVCLTFVGTRNGITLPASIPLDFRAGFC